jgi:large subunit ribosomal protein L25
MEEIVFEAQEREVTGKKVNALRRAGVLPAVLYGGGVEAFPISFLAKDVSRDLSRLSSSSLVRIKVAGREYPALVREKQRDVLTGQLLHLDFQVVSLTEIVRADVNIIQEGESPAILMLSAILVSGLETLEVEGLPQDLPRNIIVDISGLEELGDTIYVRDLDLPPNVTVLNEPDEMVILVSGQEYIEEEEELEEDLLELGEEPEVIEKGRREEEGMEEDEE